MGASVRAARPRLRTRDRSAGAGRDRTVPGGLDGLAAFAEQTGGANRAATLFGAAEGVRGTVGSAVWGIDRANRDETGSRLRARLGQKPNERLVSRGAALALDEIVEFACHAEDRPPS